MSARRFIFASLAVLAAVLATDYLIHAVWLEGLYRAAGELWRPEPEMLDRMGWVFRGEVLFSVAVVALWRFGFAPRGATLRHALLFGLLAGLFRQSETLVAYAAQPIPGRLAGAWFLSGVVQGILAALIASAVCGLSPSPALGSGRRSGRIWRIAGMSALVLLFAGPLLFRGTSQRPVSVTTDWMRPLTAQWVTESPGEEHSIRSSSEVQRNGEDSLRFELRAGEKWTDALGRSSFRSEIDTKDFPPMRSVRWYSLSVYLPESFPIDENRLVLAQWYATAKRLEGEVARSPAVALRYVNGRFSITLRHTAERIVKDAEAVPEVVLFETNSFPHAQWHDFVVHARWSPAESEGFVNVWWNGEQIARYRGPVGYPDRIGPEFRFGLYRDATDKTYVVHFNNVKSGTAPEDIGFAP